MTTPLPSIAASKLDVLTPGIPAGKRPKFSSDAQMRQQAQDFEAQFLNSMFQHMYEGIKGDGPFGNSPGVGVWRSFLTDEYSKNIVKAGGIGIADSVYQSLLAHQAAARAKQGV